MNRKTHRSSIITVFSDNIFYCTTRATCFGFFVKPSLDTLTNSMEQSPSRDSNRSSARQEILCILWKPHVHYRMYRRLPPVPILPRRSSQVRGLVKCFVTLYFLRWEGVSTSSNPKTGRQPLVGCPRLLIHCIRGYPPYLEAVPSSVTGGRAMLWWQGPTCHVIIRQALKYKRKLISKTCMSTLNLRSYLLSN
jgi:hypothetical protein